MGGTWGNQPYSVRFDESQRVAACDARGLGCADRGRPAGEPAIESTHVPMVSTWWAHLSSDLRDGGVVAVVTKLIGALRPLAPAARGSEVALPSRSSRRPRAGKRSEALRGTGDSGGA